MTDTPAYVEDANGNLNHVSYFGSIEAALAALDSLIDCRGCTDCINCEDCTDCTNCTGCTDCTGCSDCTDCVSCMGCTKCLECRDCSDCIDCSRCMGCTGCTDCRDQTMPDGNTDAIERHRAEREAYYDRTQSMVDEIEALRDEVDALSAKLAEVEAALTAARAALATARNEALEEVDAHDIAAMIERKGVEHDRFLDGWGVPPNSVVVFECGNITKYLPIRDLATPAPAELEAAEDALPAAYRAGIEDALGRIDDFNTLPPDESGHRWRESDLLDQEVMSIRALPTPAAADLAERLKEKDQ